MTVDEEFNKLDDDLRRLKIEYEVYFNGGSSRPPRDTLFRVENTIKRYSSDQVKLSFGQRYRLTSLAQKYAVYAALWRRKLQEKDEGRSLNGGPRKPVEIPMKEEIVRVVCSDPDAEKEKVIQLLEGMQEARRKAGISSKLPDADTFHEFIRAKTRDLQQTLRCEKVQFCIAVEGGAVKFRAMKGE